MKIKTLIKEKDYLMQERTTQDFKSGHRTIFYEIDFVHITVLAT